MAICLKKHVKKNLNFCIYKVKLNEITIQPFESKCAKFHTYYKSVIKL